MKLTFIHSISFKMESNNEETLINTDMECDSICTNESDDSCMQMVQFESIRSVHEDIEEAISLSWPKSNIKNGNDLLSSKPLSVLSKKSNQNELDISNPSNSIDNRRDRNDSLVDRYNTLQVSTLLEPSDMAPLFSGAEWAGKREKDD